MEQWYYPRILNLSTISLCRVYKSISKITSLSREFSTVTVTDDILDNQTLHSHTLTHTNKWKKIVLQQFITHTMLNFLNEIILPIFLELSIISFRDFKMITDFKKITWRWSANSIEPGQSLTQTTQILFSKSRAVTQWH